MEGGEMGRWKEERWNDGRRRDEMMEGGEME